MDILNQIVQSLNKEEVRFFKLYTKRIESGKDRKDVDLFDYIRKQGNEYNEEKILQKLYPNQPKNAYYRLKNRLAEDLNKCLILQHYNEGQEVQIYNLLTIVRLFLNKNEFKLAQHYLKKAEKEALKLEAHDLLDVIYSEHIKLSQELVSINPDELIQKRKENLKVLNSFRSMDDVLATVIYKSKTTQNFSSKQNPFIEVLEETVNKLMEDEELKNSGKFRTKIFRSVSQILLQRHKYETLEEFALTTYNSFLKDKLFNKNNHETKLLMLTYITNCLHINGKHQDSLKYAAYLNEAMEEYDRFLKDKFQFFYYNALVNNYGTIDKEIAISILEDLKASDWMRKTPYYEVFVHGNLAILNYDLGEYKKAVKWLHQLYLLKSYKETDASYKFKTAIAELIIRYEMNDIDFLDYRIKQVNKDFTELLSIPENERERELLSIMEALCSTPILRSNKALLSRIEAFLDSKVSTRLYSEMIDYNSWLKRQIK